MMLKNVKRVACLALAMILSVAFVLPAAANAATASSEKILPSEKAVYSFTGAESAAKLSTRMESYGVQVEDDTLFQVVSSTDGTNTLMVTNTNGDEVSQDLFMVLDEKGDVISMPVPAEEQSRGDNEGFGMDMDNVFSDGSFICRWAVLFDYRLIGSGQYFRPKHAQFVCLYSASAGYSVTNAIMRFDTEGLECDSNFNTLSDQTFLHSVVINQAVVARNTYYAKTNEYNANRWICTTGSTSDVRMDFWVNGRRYFHDWSISSLIYWEGRI